MLKRHPFVVVFLCLALANYGETTKPNVLLLVVDDLRPTLGCYGDGKVITPNIDQLASQSVVFLNAYAQQALCGPSRTSFLTSRRPDTTRAYDQTTYWRRQAGNFTTMPQYFKENGYFSYGIGKVFNPGSGSNHSDDFPYSWSEHAYHPPTEKYKMAKVCPNKNGGVGMNLLCAVNVTSQPDHSLPDIQISEHAIEMILKFEKAKNKQPFFLAVGFHKPHIPYKFPEEYLKLYDLSNTGLAPDPFIPKNLPSVAYSPWTPLRLRDDVKVLNLSFPYGPIPDIFQRKIRQHYFASVTYMDAMVGKVLDQLTKSGFANNTVIALLGDHGWSLGEHGDWCKFQNFEQVTRVPLMFHIPEMTTIASHFEYRNAFSTEKSKLRGGQYSDSLVELVDLFPTLSELAGLPKFSRCDKDSSKTLLCTEGASLLPLIKAGMTQSGFEKITSLRKDAIFSQYPRPADVPQENSDSPKLKDIKVMGYTMRTARYRYTEWVGFDPKLYRANFSDVHANELYLRDSDLHEDNNVASNPEYKKLVESLRKKLIAGWREAIPPS